MSSLRVRFAPSPTGNLHIGNLRTALFNDLLARHEGGKLVLRIEDTDPERSKPEFAKAIIKDLKLMNIGVDEGPFYQSERLETYEEYLEKLESQGQVYRCYCTQEELKARRHEALGQKRPPRYDNRCRRLSKEEQEKRKTQGIRPTMRFKVECKDAIQVEDLIRGPISFPVDEIGDFVIMRSHPTLEHKWLPTFHMSVCVDDGLMNITHVIRGEDHLSNSPRHALLFRALGFAVPKFAHLSLIHGPGGEPLSKRYGALSVSDFLEERGYLPEALRNYLALLGWSPKDNREIFTSDELVKAFEIRNALRHPAIFSEDKLQWINGEHLKQMPEKNYLDGAFKFLMKSGIPIKDRISMERVLIQLKNDIHKFDEFPSLFSFLCDETKHKRKLEKAFKENNELSNALKAGAVVSKSAESIVSHLTTSGDAFYQEFTKALAQSVTEKGKKLYIPIRAALTAETHGMELKRIFQLLEPARIRTRFEIANELISQK
jgi:nondiscriminating glutamyl-tRNA synthetase